MSVPTFRSQIQVSGRKCDSASRQIGPGREAGRRRRGLAGAQVRGAEEWGAKAEDLCPLGPCSAGATRSVRRAMTLLRRLVAALSDFTADAQKTCILSNLSL